MTNQLGEFEQVVLLAIIRLGSGAYGQSIRAEIQACTGRRTARGALFTTLDRLESKGAVRSRMGQPTPKRGGRAKRFFKVSKQGMRALIRAQSAYKKLIDGSRLARIVKFGA
jgi:PadR family transcriptional regulator PadR